MEAKRMDTKEFELPETVYVRDIETSVFQGIVLECLSKISGIAPIEGTLLLGIQMRPEILGYIAKTSCPFVEFAIKTTFRKTFFRGKMS